MYRYSLQRTASLARARHAGYYPTRTGYKWAPVRPYAGKRRVPHAAHYYWWACVLAVLVAVRLRRRVRVVPYACCYCGCPNCQ